MSFCRKFYIFTLTKLFFCDIITLLPIKGEGERMVYSFYPNGGYFWYYESIDAIPCFVVVYAEREKVRPVFEGKKLASKLKGKYYLNIDDPFFKDVKNKYNLGIVAKILSNQGVDGLFPIDEYDSQGNFCKHYMDTSLIVKELKMSRRKIYDNFGDGKRFRSPVKENA